MTFDLGEVALIVSAALFQGGQIVMLRIVVSSNRDQGRRLGALERLAAADEAAKKAVEAAVEAERRRVRHDTRGVPVAMEG